MFFYLHELARYLKDEIFGLTIQRSENILVSIAKYYEPILQIKKAGMRKHSGLYESDSQTLIF
ncbi:MAG: hypothetical protein ABEI13_02745 [Candidatus Paceibacteria bacterium]